MSDEDILKIQDYLEGSLTEKEAEQLQNRMEMSPEFSKNVMFQSKVLSLLEATKKVDRKKRMLADFRNIHKNEPINLPSFKKRQVIWYSIAASFTIVIIISIWSMFSKSSYEKTFLSYYKPYDGITVLRGKDQLFKKGMAEYNSGNYENALQSFVNTPNEDILEGQLNLLIGSCYLSINKADSSLVWFNRISDLENSVIKSNRDWYIALALLRKGNIDQSKEALKKIAIAEELYSQKASTLLLENIYK